MSVHAAWKEAEREIAARLGGKRNGPTGNGTNDVNTRLWAIEIKAYRSRSWGLATEALVQAETNQIHTSAPGTPIAILHTVGEQYDRDLVVMRAGDLYALDAILRGTDAPPHEMCRDCEAKRQPHDPPPPEADEP